MIRNIELNTQERELIIRILKEEVLEDLKEDSEVIEENKFSEEYLTALNSNNITVLMVDNLIKKLR